MTVTSAPLGIPRFTPIRAPPTFAHVDNLRSETSESTLPIVERTVRSASYESDVRTPTRLVGGTRVRVLDRTRPLLLRFGEPAGCVHKLPPGDVPDLTGRRPVLHKVRR